MSVPPASRPRLAERLADPAAWLTLVEVVPWRGPLDDPGGGPVLACAAEVAADARVSALSVTDNAGGHPMLPPQVLAARFAGQGIPSVVHVACRDRSRNALQSLGWELRAAGLADVLAVSGDFPVEGYGGLSRPVFDLDSVALLALYRELGGFSCGVAVNPYKRQERELVPQLLKLELKARTGAAYAVTQVGYDARSLDELGRWLRRRAAVAPQLAGLPVLANVYILNRGVARRFHAGAIPGCVVSDDLLALVERQAAAPDRGRAFFLEFAAKQVAVARGLGCRGVYVSGHRDAAELSRVLDLAAVLGPDDWRSLAAEVSFPEPGAFRLFATDPATGLASDELDPAWYSAIRGRGDRRRLALGYRRDRLVHRLVFDPAGPGFPLGTALYGAVERAGLGRPLHALEQAAKLALYDCRDCGDCSLPDVAYLCPESRCAKNQRNGPCGGSHDGRCEAAERDCIWALAYDRLAAAGEATALLDRPPVVVDNALRRTSSWANTFLHRDHFAARALRGSGGATGEARTEGPATAARTTREG